MRKLLLYLLILLLLVFAYMLAPWPHWVKLANVGSGSFSVGWVTKRPMAGCVIMIEAKLFPNRLIRECEAEKRTGHLIDLAGLKEDTFYRIWVTQGWRIYPTSSRQVRTFVAPLEAPLPDPGYGSVVDLAGQSVPGALVYVYPKTESLLYPEAVISNAQGSYAIDLSGFGLREVGEWIIEGGTGPDQWQALVAPNMTTPFPTLEVNADE